MPSPADVDLLPLLREFARTGDPEIGDRIVAATVELVDHIAQRYRYAGEPLEDLQQEARLGLLQASRTFDPARGVKFNTYAGHAIQGAIQHYLRDRGKLIREPGWLHDLSQKVNKASARLRQQLGREPEAGELAADLQVSPNQVSEVLRTRELFRVASLEQPAGDDPDAPPVSDEDRCGCPDGPALPLSDQLALSSALARLRPLERDVVQSFFFEDRSKAAIAAKLGCPPGHVSHLLRRALRELRELLLNDEGEPTTRELRERRAGLEAMARRTAGPSLIDPLTGLYTRRYLSERLGEEIVRSQRCGYELSVCLLQIHDLAAYRREHGDGEGDRVLCEIADVLRRSSRRSDLTGRYDRERFNFVLPHTGSSARVLAERCRATLGDKPPLQLYCGIAVHPVAGQSALELFAAAAAALQEAIAAGPAEPVQLALHVA